MESEMQGPHHRGTRQTSKPGVRPGTQGPDSKEEQKSDAPFQSTEPTLAGRFFITEPSWKP